MRRILRWEVVRSLWPAGREHPDATEAPDPYLNKYRIGSFAFAGTLGILFGLGVAATAVDAWGQSCGTPPATGQTESYPALTVNSAIPVNDDGAMLAGAALSYTDTGPTIIDNNTGLEWEKLGQPDTTNVGNGSIHDWRTEYFWSCPGVGGLTSCLSGSTPFMTIWDKEFLMNTEGGTGYAQHNDWRVPNIKELQSIVDYEAFEPAVDSEFHSGSLTGLCEPASALPGDCSFTDPGTFTSRYWSSTSNKDITGDAWFLSFALGRVDSDTKDSPSALYHVRLVRGGCSNGTPFAP